MKPVLFHHSHPEHAVDGGQLFHRILIHRLLYVNHCIGHFPPGLVGHIRDVHTLIAKAGGELGHHVGDILVEDRYPPCLGADSHITVGIIDTVDNISVL